MHQSIEIFDAQLTVSFNSIHSQLFKIHNLMQTMWEFEFYCCRKWCLALSIKSQILSNACLCILQVVSAVSLKLSLILEMRVWGHRNHVFNLGWFTFFILVY